MANLRQSKPKGARNFRIADLAMRLDVLKNRSCAHDGMVIVAVEATSQMPLKLKEETCP